MSKEDELIIERPEGPPGRKPPDTLVLPQDVMKRIGETVTLECAASGLPMPTLTWTFRNGTTVSGPRMSIVGHGNLRIINLQRRDSNVYKCTATNPDNVAESISTLSKVIIIEPPRVLASTPSHEGQLSDTVRIGCEFSGVPTPKVTVFKDAVYGTTIDNEPKHQWVITYLDDSHSGYYQCRAENEGGQVTTTMRIKIKHSDLSNVKPGNVSAIVSGPTSLRVVWDPVTLKGVSIIGYSVHYSNIEDPKGGLQVVAFKPSTELKELTPYSNISIYVVAYNSNFASGRSDKIYQIIGEDVPIAAPVVTVHPIGASSLKVTWKKLSIQKARGVITEYEVSYRQQDKGSIKMETVLGDVLECILTGLTPNMPYEVRVMGKTSKGFPQLSEDEWPWVTAYTNSQHDALEPPTMQVYALNQTAVQVRWHPSSPDNRGTAGYRLDVYSSHNEHIKRLFFVASDQQDTITGLDADTQYKISLVCLGSVDHVKQEGEPNIRNVKTLKVGEPRVLPSAPPPPQDLGVFPLNQSAVRFQWYRPKYTPGISFYTVRYMPVQNDLTKPAPESIYIKHVVTNDNDTLERLIGSLDAYTFYEFSVRTHTSYSLGAFSNVVRCRTKEGLPSAPSLVQGTLRGPGRVELTWQPPQKPNGVISHYVIHYREDTEPTMPWQTKIENGTSLVGEVDNLELEIDYNFQLKARTSVGDGPGSAILSVRTQNPFIPPEQQGTFKQEQQKGIIIGVTIAVCVIACIVVLSVFHNRCCRRTQVPSAVALGSGPLHNNTLPIHFNGTDMPNANGNRYLGNRYLGNTGNVDGDAHTMETLTPMLPPLVENEHSDSKKTSCLMVNGRSNVPRPISASESPEMLRCERLADDGHGCMGDHGERTSEHSHTSGSTCSQELQHGWQAKTSPAAVTDKDCNRLKCDGKTLLSGQQQCQSAKNKQHPISYASGKKDCEDIDGRVGESTRLLQHHHHQHTTHPSNSPTHRSSLIEYTSSPPQSRYAQSEAGSFEPSDGDASGMPLLTGTCSGDDRVQFAPSASHLRDSALTDSSRA